MAVDLTEFIHIYDNCLDSDICDFLISFFEENAYAQERCDNNGKPNFYQFNLTENRQLSSRVINVHNLIVNKIFEYKNKYCNSFGDYIFPKRYTFEQIRIKKYNPGGTDRFDTHVDVENIDTSIRFLSFLWYLNDVDIGGNTVFKGISVNPKKGTLIMFPPLWMFPHCGEPPISGPKYIMSSYLHYK
jgi:hypothetical protein